MEAPRKSIFWHALPSPCKALKKPDRICAIRTGLSGGAKAGIAIGIVLLVVVLGGAAYWFFVLRRRRRRSASLDEWQPTADNVTVINPYPSYTTPIAAQHTASSYDPYAAAEVTSTSERPSMPNYGTGMSAKSTMMVQQQPQSHQQSHYHAVSTSSTPELTFEAASVRPLPPPPPSTIMSSPVQEVDAMDVPEAQPPPTVPPPYKYRPSDRTAQEP